ncbi:MAG TPA: hypothetical protein VFE31_04330 [Opitutaceae bacterium]|jgi:hypothetical protein|nr:hypothetical protein [Opitutaceae bacterium]
MAVILCALLAAVPPVLQEAVTRNRAEAEHWAYTETIRGTDERGRPVGATILRVDPSLPYADQFQPIEVEGHAPAASDRRDFRRLGERIGRELAERPPDAPAQIEVGGMKAVIRLDAARLVAEDARDWAYALPLEPVAGSDLPVKKLQLILRISKATRGYDTATLRLIAPWRTHLVFKVTAGQLDLRWAVVDPKHPPLMVEERGSLAVSVLFLHVGGWLTVQRADFKRVTPYADRFGVKVGPLRALPF